MPWVVGEMFEGDGVAGAAFCLPGGMTVFVSEMRDSSYGSRMTDEAYALACAIRDMIKAISEITPTAMAAAVGNVDVD